MVVEELTKIFRTMRAMRNDFYLLVGDQNGVFSWQVLTQNYDLTCHPDDRETFLGCIDILKEGPDSSEHYWDHVIDFESVVLIEIEPGVFYNVTEAEGGIWAYNPDAPEQELNDFFGGY